MYGNKNKINKKKTKYFYFGLKVKTISPFAMRSPVKLLEAVISALPFSKGQTEGIFRFKFTFFNETLLAYKTKTHLLLEA